MKRFVLFLLIVCALFLVGCGGGSDENDTAEFESQTEAEVYDPSKFNIFFGDSYKCRVIVSDTADETEKAVYNRIRDRLRNLTGQQIPITTDFLAFNDAGEDRKEPAILVGYTNYEESKQVYSELRCGESKVKMVGNKLVLAFSSELDANAAYAQFVQLLKGLSPTNICLETNIDLTKISNKTLNAIPNYRAGKTDIVNCGNDTHMIHAVDADMSEFDAYRDKLLSDGYVQQSERTVEGNVFYTLVQEPNYIYMYYRPSDSTARVVLGPTSSLAKEDYSSDTGVVCEPSLTVIGQAEGIDIGQGYIFLLPDGRVIIQDGGQRSSKKSDIVYNALIEVVPDPENIVIAAWFVSHPHTDHQAATEEFLENHGKDEGVTIESFVVNYAPSTMYSYKRADGARENSGGNVSNLFSLFKRYAPEAQVIKAHTGQILKYGENAYVEILYTPEDYLPAENFNYVNSSSLVIRTVVEDSSVLLLADTTHASGRIIEKMFGEHLKSDMVQLAHHGMAPSNSSLYECVKAEVLLWPSNHSTAGEMLKQYSGVINTALSFASDLYVADTALVTLPLPYECLNNKEAELEKLNK